MTGKKEIEWTVPAPEKGSGIVDFAPFKTKREKKCEIETCGYSNMVQVHHIIELSDGGDHCEENIILLCPNHHAEVAGIIKLEKEGKRCEAFYKIEEFANFWASLQNKKPLSEEEKTRLSEYNKKYGFDKDHAIAYRAGISRKTLWDTYRINRILGNTRRSG